MTEHGAQAFSTLERVINGEQSAETFADPPFERLRLALYDPDTSELDKTVLLRHALRYESLRRQHSATMKIPAIDPDYFEQVGIIANEENGVYRVSATPWRPEWMPDAVKQPIDQTAMEASRKRFFENRPVSGDPFLEQFQLSGYRSEGQKTAVRSALSMPPGTGLVVDLPTGEGKSLIFRTVDKVGFASDADDGLKHITLVIVPTVTLAFDHERSCGGSEDNPLAYIGGLTERNSRIRENISSGTQGLLFAAPEAVVGPLRYSLAEAVKRGRLRAIVIDEAHLVESWGTGFRTEFQTFAGLCQQWRDEISEASYFRLIFLSATFSDIAKTTLNELFSFDQELKIVSAGSLRPEPEFWVGEMTNTEEREARVLQALSRLPRPLILYLTKVEEAEKWFHRLRGLGFGRLRMVHGGTGARKREEILKLWAAGSLDVVVATSAFGLGIDYPHVRSIIHACLPEKLDRFYQEVGRAGRDGCASISLLLPAFEDRQIAKSLSIQKVISVDRGLQRWEAMFTNQSMIDHGNSRYSLRLDVAPSNSAEDIDLIGQRSIDWNARLMSLMARSGLVKLAGIPELPEQIEGERPPYQTVELLVDEHLSPEIWNEFVEKKRQEISDASNRSFQLLEKYLANHDCPAELIGQLYEDSAKNCSGCKKCRLNPMVRHGAELVPTMPVQWPLAGNMLHGFNDLTGHRKRLIVEYHETKPDRRTLKEFAAIASRLDFLGLRIFVSIADVPEWFKVTFHSVMISRPWVHVESESWNRYPWPKGNSIIVLGKSVEIASDDLNYTDGQHQEIIFVPVGATDSFNHERQIADVLQLPVMSFEVFLERMQN
jgi:ATP-dependent DNA helicase RecQ